MENNRPAMPDNHLVKAILTLLFCCLPFGIVSLVYATKVENYYVQGDYEMAQKASRDADKYANYAIIAGVAWVVLCILYYAVIGASLLFI